MRYILCIFFLLLFPSSFAQATNAYADLEIMRQKDLALFIGYNGWRHHYGEIGIGVHSYGIAGHHPVGSGWSLGSEIRAHKNLVIAPKFSLWAGGGAGGMCLRISALYYTNFLIARAAVRPEIGVGGFGYFTIVYGYNFYLNKQDLLGLNKSVVSLILPVKLKELKKGKLFN
jgi:hypothetical protein